MKAVSVQRKPQYTSNILVTPSSTQNKNSPKLRGNSVESHREKALEMQDHEPLSLNSLITQSPKDSTYRPSTSGGGCSPPSQVCSQRGTISPKPSIERPGYSLSPSRVSNIVKILPPKSKSFATKKTLVLDLDETLVHSGFRPFNIPSDIILKIELDNKVHDIHVLVRPGVEEFLQRMAKHYEIILFTASLSKYADPLIDKLDHKKVCAFRLFREHCTMINNAFVKDLKKLDRDLKDLLIVDNSPVSYALNMENGFPIKTWYDDKNDRELHKISLILEFLAYVPDIREYIKRMVEKNELSYPKAMSLINSYNIALKESQMRSLTPVMSSCSKNNFLPFSNGGTTKSVKDGYFQYQIEKEKEKWHNSAAYGSNLTANIESPSLMNCMPETRMQPQSPKEKKEEAKDNKQINIKIINNNFTHYIINPQESVTQEVVHKPIKGINTFRSSCYSQNSSQIGGGVGSPYNSEPGNRGASMMSKKDIIPIYASSPNSPVSQVHTGIGIGNSSVMNNNINNGKYNIKNLNINIAGNEVKSPVLKSSQQYISQNYCNPNIAKYSSLIEQGKENIQIQNQNPNTARPSSAVIIKPRHNRELSGNRKDPISFMPGSQLYRSPSTQSMVHALNRNYSKPNLTTIKRDASSQNYLTNIHNVQNIKDLASHINAGHNTVRARTSNERLRLNNTNANNNNNNPQINIKEIRTPNGRYVMDDILPHRGYSRSSRSVDNKAGYRYRDNNDNNYASPTSKFTAAGIYRGNNK